MKRCAFLTIEELGGFVVDDELAAAPLAALGWSLDLVPWRARGARWSDYDLVVVRSTWDYHEAADEFFDLLAAIEREAGGLLNPLPLMRWNAEKGYLQELERRGAPCAPTIWGAGLTEGELAAIGRRVGHEEWLIKPTVSANSHGAFRVDPAIKPEAARAIESYYGDERAWMAQPLAQAVLTEGEFSVVFFEGRASHALRKVPQEGDFRVQETYGGIVVPEQAKGSLLAAAERALGALEGTTPLYARADFVRAPAWADEEFWLLELELIEPSLYLSVEAGASARFARAIDRAADL